MSLRSRLGLSLASLTLGASLACGPKPQIQVEQTTNSGGSLHLTDGVLGYIEDVRELLFDGKISKGDVIVNRSFYSKADTSRTVLKVRLFMDKDNTQINFLDFDNSGAIGDHYNDYVYVIHFGGDNTNSLRQVYQLNRCIMPSDDGLFGPIINSDATDPISRSVFQSYSKKLMKVYSPLYKELIQEVADSLNFDLHQ